MLEGTMHATEHKSDDGVKTYTANFESTHNENKDEEMGDIAGLLALMQNNRGMDIPGLLALCKEKGYDRGWGSDSGMFMFVFLILFLFAGGGWNGLNRGQQAEFAAMAGNNCQEIIGLHDRISAAQAASTNGFQQLQTWLCQAIDAANAATRDQGDRVYNATRNVGDTVRDCCCELRARIDGVTNQITNLYGHTSLLQERTVNAMQAMECRLDNEIKENRRIIELGFERQACLIRDTARDQEMGRLLRENEQLKDTLRGNRIADAAVSQLQAFALSHYTPTVTAAATTTPAAAA